MATKNETLKLTEIKAILATLQARFQKHPGRHTGIVWQDVEQKLLTALGTEVMRALLWMEATGGEPDVVGLDKKTGKYIFFDCSVETPEGRRSLCYDEAALRARKENKPAGSAIGLASSKGVEVLSETQYRHLQSLGHFDTKTSSWLNTPDAIRKLGGAIFGDYRYGQVFIYHNGVQSYYASRGFRCCVML
ncbi:MAG: DUF4256 domain-containing protein [Chitinophagaceae bacterium]|nr:MAG: DUF4256 domain-containing protein [Chitinophagaceae bacterium]